MLKCCTQSYWHGKFTFVLSEENMKERRQGRNYCNDFCVWELRKDLSSVNHGEFYLNYNVSRSSCTSRRLSVTRTSMCTGACRHHATTPTSKSSYVVNE